MRGIPDDLRRAVAERARKEGKTIGAWMTEALRRALEQDDTPAQIAKLIKRVEVLEQAAAGNAVPHRLDPSAQ